MIKSQTRAKLVKNEEVRNNKKTERETKVIILIIRDKTIDSEG
jgi:hypothetical protein